MPQPFFVQGNVAAFGSISTPQNISFGSNVQSGNILVVDVAYNPPGSPPTMNVTDSLGNTYVPLEPTSSGLSVNTYTATSVAAGPCTVTVNPNGSTMTLSVAVHEYQATVRILNLPDGKSPNNSSGTAWTTLSIGSSATGQQRDFFHAAFASLTTNVLTPGANFVIRETDTSTTPFLWTMDFPNGSQSATALTATSNTSQAFVSLGFSWTMLSGDPSGDFISAGIRTVGANTVFEEEHEDVHC